MREEKKLKNETRKIVFHGMIACTAVISTHVTGTLVNEGIKRRKNEREKGYRIMSIEELDERSYNCDIRRFFFFSLLLFWHIVYSFPVARAGERKYAYRGCATSWDFRDLMAFRVE